MPTNLLDESTLMLVADAVEKVIGRPISASSVRRWMVESIRGVKLETMMIGGRRMTTTEAVRRFLAAINDAPSLKRGGLSAPAARRASAPDRST